MKHRLAIDHLHIANYRNYESLTFAPEKNITVITGSNGAGKTNLLEAISFLTPGRGLRRIPLDQCDYRPCSEANFEKIDVQPTHSQKISWSVVADINGLMGNVRIGTGRDINNNKRVVRLDEQTQSSQHILSEHLSIVWLTPQMERLFNNTAQDRRRFLDRMVYSFDPAHSGRISRYEKLLRQRTHILKNNINGKKYEQEDDLWLRSIEEQMAQRAIAITAARLNIIHKLNQMFDHNKKLFPQAKMCLSGAIEERFNSHKALEVEDWMQEKLRENRNQDAISGGASIGVHRSDLKVARAKDHYPAELCSTGEQKLLLIATIFAFVELMQAERGALPIVLLDDIAAHLDQQHRRMLFQALAQYNLQAFLTGTEVSHFDALKHHAQYITINNAKLHIK